MSTDRVLTFDIPEPAAAHIYDESGHILYYVKTHSFHDSVKHITEVHGAEKDVLATLEWYDDLRFYVIYGNGERQELDHWAHTSSIPFVHSVTVHDQNGHPYKWKIHEHHRKMELFDEKEGSSEYPIAHIVEPSDKTKGVAVHIVPTAWECRDFAVISFLFLDKKHRVYDFILHNINFPGGGRAPKYYVSSEGGVVDVMPGVKDDYDPTVRE